MKFLIAGLGNIGSEYEGTRHNVGFTIADELVKSAEGKFESSRYADVAEIKIKGKILVVIKPTTYMNLSGNAIRYYLQQEKIEKNNLLVVVDDLALPFGAIRLRGNGSDAGHNGLRNIQEVLATAEYPRLRFGIGNDFAKGKQSDFVLGKWSPEELKLLPERVTIARDAVKAFCLAGLARAMNDFNKR
jgi:peptidyl-tRNA hydrolase, PTH1 family